MTTLKNVEDYSIPQEQSLTPIIFAGAISQVAGLIGNHYSMSTWLTMILFITGSFLITIFSALNDRQEILRAKIAEKEYRKLTRSHLRQEMSVNKWSTSTRSIVKNILEDGEIVPHGGASRN